MTISLLEKVMKPSPVDWRYPDHFGITERTLDCRQLAIHEVLKWKHEAEPIRIFLNAFDCKNIGLKLRRKAPELEMGWQHEDTVCVDPGSLKQMICHAFKQEGYCLLFYEAFEAEFLRYYNVHQVEHWSLVVDCNDKGITILDEAGAKSFFHGHVGTVPWSVLFSSFNRMNRYGLSTLFKTEAKIDWDHSFSSMIAASVERMFEEGLQCLGLFIDEVSLCPLKQLVSELESLEFDVHYYRKLRELWQLAVVRSVVPAQYLKSEWVEELFYVCKCWSLILGVIMKWKRQPHRDYRYKLVDYLRQTQENEERMFAGMAKLFNV